MRFQTIPMAGLLNNPATPSTSGILKIDWNRQRRLDDQQDVVRDVEGTHAAGLQILKGTGSLKRSELPNA